MELLDAWIFDTWLWRSIPPTLVFLAYVMVASGVVALLVSFVAYRVHRSGIYSDDLGAGLKYTWGQLFIPAFVLALIGGMSGQLGGGSRSSVVGDLVPALFTLVGAYSTYLLGTEKSRSPFLIPNGLSFVFAFFVLYNLSAVWRQENELEQFCLQVFSNADFNSTVLLSYRHATFSEYCRPVFE